MNIKKELEKIDKAEKALRKQIDDEVNLEQEIQEVSKYTAKILNGSPMAPFSIQGRNFMVVAAVYSNEQNEQCIQLVAREKLNIEISTPTVIKADLVIDTNYTREENLVGGLKALLGHITGHIKPEAMD